MRIKRSHLTIRPTGHGLLFLGILVAMLLGSINYNNNAGFTLVFLLGNMGFISLFHSYKNLVGIEVSLLQQPGIFAGGSLIFSFQIKSDSSQNEAADPKPDGKGHSKGWAKGRTKGLPAGQSLGLAFKGKGTALVRHSRDRMDLVMETRTRGPLDPGDLSVFSFYPFGLFRMTARLPLNIRGLVYPAPLKGELSVGGIGTGSLSMDRDTSLANQAAGRGPDDFQGLSPYVPGSPMGRISWKAYSRELGLFVKDFSGGDSGGQVLLDMDKIKAVSVEAKLSILCRALIDAHKSGILYGLRLANGRFHEPGTGERHFYQCLESLALFGFERTGV